MNLFFLHHPAKNPKDKAREQRLVPLRNHGHNSNEGGEFLDDALRTEDLPALHVEENSTDGDHKP